MPLPNHIAIIEMDDWVQVFKDDVLIYENHRITGQEMLYYLGIDYDQHFIEDWNHDNKLFNTYSEWEEWLENKCDTTLE